VSGQEQDLTPDTGDILTTADSTHFVWIGDAWAAVEWGYATTDEVTDNHGRIVNDQPPILHRGPVDNTTTVDDHGNVTVTTTPAVVTTHDLPPDTRKALHDALMSMATAADTDWTTNRIVDIPVATPAQEAERRARERVRAWLRTARMRGYRNIIGPNGDIPTSITGEGVPLLIADIETLTGM